MSEPTSNALEIMDAEFAHDLTYRIEVEIARRDAEIERLRAQVEQMHQRINETTYRLGCKECERAYHEAQHSREHNDGYY